MPNPFPSSGVCPDRLVLQRWCDGDLSPSEIQRVGDHVSSCVTCRAECARLEQERTFITVRLGEEDESWAAEARGVLESVERRLAVSGAAPDHQERRAAGWLSRVRGRLRAFQGAGSRRRAAAGATALAALIVGTAIVLDRWPMSASAERVLTDGQVRERAWRFTPGKVRMQTVRYDWREQGQPDRSAVRTLWFSTVPGHEGYTSRQVDASGTLVAAWWMRTDGSSAHYAAEPGPVLVVEPSLADLDGFASTLPPERAAPLRLRIEDLRGQLAAQEQFSVVATGSGSFALPTGEILGHPRLLREGGSYRLTYEVALILPRQRGSVLFVEDRLSASDLAFERRLLRLSDAQGRVSGETDQRVLSRSEADPAQYERLMREVDEPPASWQLRRRTPAEVLAWATSVYGSRAPRPTTMASPAQPAAPSTSR